MITCCSGELGALDSGPQRAGHGVDEKSVRVVSDLGLRHCGFRQDDRSVEPGPLGPIKGDACGLSPGCIDSAHFFQRQGSQVADRSKQIGVDAWCIPCAFVP